MYSSKVDREAVSRMMVLRFRRPGSIVGIGWMVASVVLSRHLLKRVNGCGSKHKRPNSIYRSKSRALANGFRCSCPQ
jgi:hypothetical protein